MCVRILMLGAALVCAVGAIMGDAIVVDGVAYKNVYVRESGARYYIQLPKEGRAFSVPKERVTPGDVFIEPNEEARAALLREWKENREKRRAALPPPAAPNKNPRRLLRLDAQPTPATPPRAPAQPGLSPLIPMEAAESAAPVAPRVPTDGAFAMPPAPPKPRTAGVARPQTQTPAPLSSPPPLLRAAPTEDRGIRERMQGVDEEGVPVLVLKGTTEKDPSRDRYILMRIQEEQARIAEEQRQQEMAYQQFLWEQQAAFNPMLTNPGYYPQGFWGEAGAPQTPENYPQQASPLQQSQTALQGAPQPQTGQQSTPAPTPATTTAPQQPQGFVQQPNPGNAPAPASPQDALPQTSAMLPQPVETEPSAPAP